jgi:hypothetical protein
LLSVGSKDAYLSIFFDSALISKGWLDPNREESNKILSNMIENITSGRSGSYEAIQEAHNSLDIIMGRSQ